MKYKETWQKSVTDNWTQTKTTLCIELHAAQLISKTFYEIEQNTEENNNMTA